MSQWTAPSGHKPCLPWCGLPDLAGIGVVLPPNTAAPPGVAQICSVSDGKLISNEPAPHTCLKERSVHRLRKPERNASSVREAHFLGIDGRMLCLFGVGIPQQISGRA